MLSAFQGGEAGALRILVERYQTALLRHARSVLGPIGPCEDVVQEAFLKLVQKPPTAVSVVQSGGSDPGSRGDGLSSWLHTVVRNACMDWLRSETRRKRREETVARESATATCDWSAGDEASGANETRELVENCLQRLPDEQREVLVLRLLGQRSYREIAEITGKKVGTIGWMVSTGLKTLSAQLSGVLDRPLIHKEQEAPARLTELGPAHPKLDLAQGELS